MARALYWWKLVGLPATVIGVGYVLLAVTACTMVDRALYYPNYGSRRAPEGLKKVRAADGTNIAVLHLPNPNARFTLWFCHGNAEDLGDLEPFFFALRDRGYAVFAFDYPGYGLSDGKPGEASLYEAARAARTYLRDTLHVPPERTLLFGRSLGGGVVVQLATEEHVAGLVLQSAFVSAFRVATRWRVLPFDQFENLKKIPRIRCPVLVMHGEQDEVIPFRHGKALFAAASEPKRSLWVAGARHNDFVSVAGRKYWDALREFDELCAESGAAGR